MTTDVEAQFSERDFTRSVDQWITSGGDPNVRHPVSGTTLIHTAAELQDLIAVEVLAKAGADLSAQDAYGQTPLHIALDSELDEQDERDASNRLQVTKRLLELGADPSVADRNGLTPSDWAQECGSIASKRFEDLIKTIRRGSGC